MKSHTVMQRRIFSKAQTVGLSLGQPKVLDYLCKHEGSDQKTIAAYCEIEPATLVSILARMEQKGLIERRQKQGNRRSLYVYLTDEGRKAAEYVEEIFDNYDNEAQAGLTPDEVVELKGLLMKVCENLRREGI